jgi:hypothetical protein
VPHFFADLPFWLCLLWEMTLVLQFVHVLISATWTVILTVRRVRRWWPRRRG